MRNIQQIVELIAQMESIGAPRRELTTYILWLKQSPRSRGGKLFLIYKQRSQSPLSLKDSARIAIRKSLTHIRFRIKLATLPLPPVMKDFIACETPVDISDYLPLPN